MEIDGTEPRSFTVHLLRNYHGPGVMLDSEDVNSEYTVPALSELTVQQMFQVSSHSSPFYR